MEDISSFKGHSCNRMETEDNYKDLKNSTARFLFIAVCSNQSFTLNILMKFPLCHTLPNYHNKVTACT